MAQTNGRRPVSNNQQYAELAAGRGQWSARYDEEVERMRPGLLGDIPMLMIPAGQVEPDGSFPSCEAEGCALRRLLPMFRCATARRAGRQS